MFGDFIIIVLNKLLVIFKKSIIDTFLLVAVGTKYFVFYKFSKTYRIHLIHIS